jgi:hypothetical protein
MVLPTRDDFLANALEPVEHEEHEDCWICKEPMTSPVRTPCKHDFCKHCITEWPAQPEGDTCPVCRRSLFQPTVLSVERDAHEDAVRMAERIARSDEMLTRSERLVRDMCVREASEAAVLLDDEFLRDINARTDFRSADILDLNNHIRWSEERLIQWSPDARQMLNNDLPRLPHGAVRIDAESLGTSLILMSNALMHLATAEARPWNYAVRAIWRQMVMKIWQIIAPEHGLLLVRESFYLAIMSSLIEQQYVNEVGQDHIPPMFFRNDELVRDLRFMVNFLVDHAGPTMSSETAQEELAAHRIEAPRVYTSNVSARAERMAAEYTSMTFVHS